MPAWLSQARATRRRTALDALGMIQAMGSKLPVIACTLTTDGQRERLDDWKSLLAVAESREQMSSGMRFRFRPDLGERVRPLAAAEQECCSFLRFDLVEAEDALVLTVETEEAGREALRFIFG